MIDNDKPSQLVPVEQVRLTIPVLSAADWKEITVESPETEIRTVDGEDWVFNAGVQVTPLGCKKSLPNEWCHIEPGYTIGRCKMIKRNGDRCALGVRAGWTVCWKHGAGRTSSPGGLSNRFAANPRHSKHLPQHLLESYEEYLTDPDTLVMSQELALLDARMAELLERLETADVAVAWTNIRRAHRILDNEEVTADDYEKALEMLGSAIDAKGSDVEIWSQVVDLVERRRKVADTERRRIMDSQHVMTVQEANMFVAFLMDTVMRHVPDMQVRRAISDELKKVML